MLVKNHCRGIVRLLKGKLELRPGDNDVPVDLWKKVQGSKHVAQLIAQKRLSVGVGCSEAMPLPNPPAPQTDAAHGFELNSPPETLDDAEAAVELTTDMTAKDAIKLVKKSDDEAWLDACYQADHRSTVVDAISARMDELDILSEDD